MNPEKPLSCWLLILNRSAQIEKEQLAIVVEQRLLCSVLVVQHEQTDFGEWLHRGFDQVLPFEDSDAQLSGAQLLPHFVAAQVQFGAIRAMQRRIANAEHLLTDKTPNGNARQRLMCVHPLTEREAYRRLQRHSMDTNPKMTDLARQVISQSLLISLAEVSSGTKNG